MTAPASRTALIAWACYDWANSAFFTVIITFVFAAYFTSGIAPDDVTGTAYWGWTMTASALLVAVASPVLGAIADADGRRKPWLLVLTAIGVIGSALLWYAEAAPGFVIYTLVVVGIANVAMEMSGVFYNAMLGDLVPEERLGRLSGWAWALGYAGGLACLLAALLLFVQTEEPLFGLDKAAAEHVRVTGPLVAVWLALFALPMFLLTPDRPRSGRGHGEAIREGLRQLKATLTNLRRFRTIARFLLARMIYIDGLNTLFAFGGIYAAGTFGMEMAEVIQFGIVLNVTAGAGAFAFAWIDDWIGAKRTILVALAGLTVFGLIAVLAQDVTTFWVAACLLGIFIGPTQAASRSFMTRIAPPDMRTEMFGLYALSGKITAFVGPFVLGTVTLWADSQRAGMATILVFFLAGMALLWGVREPCRGAGDRAAHKPM